jgi:hypothetical protein
MKYFLFSIFFLFSVNLSFSQNAVNWTWKYDQSNQSIVFNAQLSDGWHLYSQHIGNDIGPVPTAFSFKPSEKITLIDQVQEPVPVQKYDENFEATLDFFEHSAEFIQKIEVMENTWVEGFITYMICNETMCLPPVDLPFSIEITK